MKIIAENTAFDQEIISSVKSFFKRFSVGHVLSQANAYKSKGFSPLSIVVYLVQLVFMRTSMHRDSRNGEKSVIGSSVDAVYRFMRDSHINWSAFMLSVATNVCKWVKSLTSEKRLTALVLDDTLYQRENSKKLELVSRVFDHTDRRYKRGFRSLFLGWTD